MKHRWPTIIILTLCLLIPIVCYPNTFDQYGVPKMVLFLFGSSLLLGFILCQYKKLYNLPKSLFLMLGAFIGVQIFQTLRLSNITTGIFGVYGQSESLLVQIGFIIYFLASYLFIGNEKDLGKLKTVILITIYIISCYGIFQYFNGDPFTKSKITRIKSLFGDPNSLGIYLVLTLPLLITELQRFYAKPYQFVISGALFLGIITLFLTFSRSSWLGFLMILFLWALWLVFQMIRNKNFNRQHLIIAAIVVGIVLAGIFLGHISTAFQAVSHTDYTLEARVSSISKGHDSGRGLIWSTAWNIFQNSPWIGYGLGSFQPNFHLYKSIAAVRFWGPSRNLDQTHNESLHYLATQGLLGFFSFWGLLLTIFLAAKIGGFFNHKTSVEQLMLWLAIIGYLFCMQLNYPLIHYSYLFWVYLGVLVREHIPTSNPLTLTNDNSKNLLKIIGLIVLIFWIFFLTTIFRADLSYRKAFLNARYHHFSESLSYYHKAVSLNPWSYQYQYRELLTLTRAAKSEKSKQFHLTKDYLIPAKKKGFLMLKIYPDCFKIKFLMGQIAEIEMDFKEAKKYYSQALQLNPKNYEIMFRLAKMEEKLGNQKESLRIFNTGLQLNEGYMRKMQLKEGSEARKKGS